MKCTAIEKLSRQRYLFFMLLPTLVLISIFTYKPVTYWVVAFTDYRVGKGYFSGKWNNFRAFIDFFRDSHDAGRIIFNTLSINLSSLAVNILASLVFAILLNEIRTRWIKTAVQTFSLLPFCISWVSGYSLFLVFLSVNSGLLNNFMVKWGIVKEGINFLGDPKFALPLIVFSNLWKGLGYNTIIYLATIAGIEQEQYESAEIDGAGRWGKIWHITLPSLTATMGIILILNSGWILSSNMDQFMQFTKPTNLAAMEVFDMYVYRYGLKLMRITYATAVGICKTIVSIVLIILSNTLYHKLTERTLF
jgi:putative aldouronate transport system permease protein